MLINKRQYRSIWLSSDDDRLVQAIDQRELPWQTVIIDLKTSDDAFNAIRNMAVRGAPLIGVTGALGLYLATLEAPGNWFDKYIAARAIVLKEARPTAVNLRYGVDRVYHAISKEALRYNKQQAAKAEALQLIEEEVARSEAIGRHGVEIIKTISSRKRGACVNILTHCNAGWLACIDYGTATAPIYLAKQLGIDLHVWVDETRPRNQGARLTAWELSHNNIPHTLIADNTGGHLMQQGLVDMVLVGSDRVARNGDAANKIGTYLKALAAKDNNIPFYVALPTSTMDNTIEEGSAIPVEEREQEEVLKMEGRLGKKRVVVDIANPGTTAANFAFDITPARLITGIITENGLCLPEDIYLCNENE